MFISELWHSRFTVLIVTFQIISSKINDDGKTFNIFRSNIKFIVTHSVDNFWPFFLNLVTVREIVHLFHIVLNAEFICTLTHKLHLLQICAARLNQRIFMVAFLMQHPYA